MSGDTTTRDTRTTDTPTDTSGTSDGDRLTFTCPRCEREASGRFYGPCGACRDELRDIHGVTAREVEAVEYEPKMNVTPNAVATKD